MDNKPFEREIRRQRAGMLAGSDRAADAIDDLVEELAEATAEGDNDVAMTARYHLAMAYLNGSRPLDAADLLEEMLVGLDGRRHGGRVGAAHAGPGVPGAGPAGRGDRSAGAHRRERCPAGPPGPGRPRCPSRSAQLLDRLDRDALAAGRFAAASVGVRAGRTCRSNRCVRPADAAPVAHVGRRSSTRRATALEQADLARAGHRPTGRRRSAGSERCSVSTAPGSWRSAVTWTPPSSGVRPTIDGFTTIGDPDAAAFAAAIHGGFLVQAGRHEQAEPILRVAIADGDDDARQPGRALAGPGTRHARPRRRGGGVRAAHGLDG